MPETSDYQYHLPQELIAQKPLDRRSSSRLMVLAAEGWSHRLISDLPSLLQPGDRLVFNNTRVIPARLFGYKQSGGKLEMMLERVIDARTVLAKLRASRTPKIGGIIILSGSNGESIEAQVTARRDDLFELKASPERHPGLAAFIERHGQIPLPPYINRQPDDSDLERYQTVFAEVPGAVAAPTAGLHFDSDLLHRLADAGIEHSFITLHVGAGTFQPIRVSDVSAHVMHVERVDVPQCTVDDIHQTRQQGGRVIAVGTTCVRSLEAAALQADELQAWAGETDLFITPGFTFRVIDGLITNFHLPGSTLLMLVAALAGKTEILQAYREAVMERYRFFSYGDAMLIWPGQSNS